MNSGRFCLAVVYVDIGDEAAASEDIKAAYANGIDRQLLDELIEEARQAR